MQPAQLDRQLRPIYDAIDSGSNKTAILACNKLLKKSPNNNLVKALKALALVRTQKVEESLVLCDEVLASKTTDDATLSAMMHVLRGLGRHNDMISMFEEAYKKQPHHEELGVQTFFAIVRTGNWKAAQQLAMKMHKQFQEDRYIYWSVISAVLQAKDPSTPASMLPVLFKLSHRLLSSAVIPSHVSADRFYLHLSILKELQLWDDAHQLLTTVPGNAICETSLIVDEIRREVWKQKGLWEEEKQIAQRRITEKGDRNWLEFLAVLDATFSMEESAVERVEEARKFFSEIAELDGRKDRSGPLALLELEKRARERSISEDPKVLESYLKSYFDQFGDKACCFEDLKPYIALSGESLAEWTSHLRNTPVATETQRDLQRTINVLKLLRHNLSEAQVSEESEVTRADKCLELYLEGLELGKDLPKTELQPADDLIILCAHALVNAWNVSNDESHLYKAAVALEVALVHSQQAYQIRLTLIRIYHLLGAPSSALEHYRGLNLKQIQNDTLSHLILSRASTFALASTGDLTYSTECGEASQIYIANSSETSEYVVRAFSAEKYSQIPEFIEFEDRLENSLQRDLAKMEHVRMRVFHESVNADLTDMELIELKFIFARLHHDNRDYEIFSNYQPRYGLSFNEQTTLFGQDPGFGWLHTFLKIYIRAFQQASDLDETVEEKLLVGDRPKQTNDPGRPLKERLVQRNDKEEQNLTPHERQFFEFTSAIAEWLEPFHNHVRPSPTTVLADAMKQNELKTGKPLRGIELPAEDGSNEQKEPPQVTPPPEIVTVFFDDMQARLAAALDNDELPPELLQIVALTQEALILLNVETTRFKPSSIVKVHKLSALVQSFKEIKAKGVAVIQKMSADITTKAQEIGDNDSKQEFIDACESLKDIPQIGPKFIASEAARLADSRRKVLEGIAKGMLKIATTHA
ncbi:actin cytoskeleton organization protein [Thelephora terrestris]|uniref:Actin cytoskeleton organization protein n=1 Tax=Thelephora terrestris TaxID=56493 RepID=A0A9P6HP51_9AGAM|nr:actin cytoskeleton organization protein [Thelephora terrestris]